MRDDDHGPAAPIGDGLRAQYRAGRTAAIPAARPDVENLVVRGRDALDLLHRLSTNDLKSLREGEGAATVFTTSKGRILDLATIHRLPGGLLVLCGEGRSAALRAWIEKYTFREEVSVEERPGTHGTLGIFGPRSANVVSALWGPGAAALRLHHVGEVPAGNEQAHVVRAFPLGGDGYLISAPAGALQWVRRAALHAQESRPVEAGRECLEVLRIEAGLPAPGRELTEDYNPWEARLQDAISLDKGCYVGQEVVARLKTYNKVSKQLVRLSVRGAGSPADEIVVPGALIRIDAETVGGVTSSAAVPGGRGRMVALGYVRDEEAVADRPAEVVRAGRSAPATIEGVAR